MTNRQRRLRWGRADDIIAAEWTRITGDVVWITRTKVTRLRREAVTHCHDALVRACDVWLSGDGN